MVTSNGLPDTADKGLLGSLQAWLVGLPAGALFFLLFGGTILMGALDTAFSFVVFLALLALLWGGGATLAGTFGRGIGYKLLWLVLAFILFFNVGRLMDHNDYWAFVFHMLLVLGIMAVICLNRYQMTVWKATATVLVGASIYLAVGIPVGIWKWHNYNAAQFEHLLNRQADWLIGAKTELNNQREAEKRAAELAAKKAAAGEQDTQAPYVERDTYLQPDERLKFTAEETAAIDAMVVTDYAALRTKEAIPAALKDRWLKYVTHYDIRLPTLLESKATFFGWVSAWPGVLIYLVFDDVVERFVNWIYAKVEYYLTYIQRQIVGDRLEFLKQAP